MLTSGVLWEEGIEQRHHTTTHKAGELRVWRTVNEVAAHMYNMTR